MKIIAFLIPVYNDWESLKILLKKIDFEIENFQDCKFKLYIVNDASNLERPKNFNLKNFENFKIFNMINNKGHARCNAFGLRYLSKNINKENFDNLIVMDSDGEDRPEEIKKLISKSLEDQSKSVVAKRIKRSEGFFFQSLYKIHKIITLIFTGKNINFGNYSCLLKKDIVLLAGKKSLWSSFSGTLKKYLISYNEVESERGLRYFGPSKMSLFNLLIHSFSIIAVFKKEVFLRSLIFLILLIILANYFGIFFVFLQFILIIFNILIYLTSLRENEIDLQNSDLNLKDINIITN